MAYNPYSAVNAIYNLKGQWDTANSSNDTVGKNNAAKKAQAYYNQLRKNGYSDVADALTASNYAQAKNIRDKWAKMLILRKTVAGARIARPPLVFLFPCSKKAVLHL